MRKLPKGVKGMELVLGLVLAAFLLCNIIAPFTLPQGSVKDLSGSVGKIDNEAQISHFNPFAQVIYYIGDYNCHQIAARSYYLNGNELPVCSRDIGILTALPLTLFALAYTGFRPKFWMVIVLLVPMGIDGGLQVVSSYTSFNELRTVTGLFAGVAGAFFLAILAKMALSPEKDAEQHLSE